MKDKRILITGGAGLIGSHIADLAARDKPAEIVILDNFVRGRRENLAEAIATAPVTIIEGDIRDRALLPRRWTGSMSCSTRRRSASPNAPRSRGSPSTSSLAALSTCSRPR